jgi:hypothetical protein
MTEAPRWGLPTHPQKEVQGTGEPLKAKDHLGGWPFFMAGGKGVEPL